MTTLPKNRKPARSNRNWIKPPNTMVRQGSKNSPKKLSYWTDSDNRVKLYTQEQLATCNILMNLNLLLVRALVLLDILKTLDDNAKIADLIHQDYAKFEASDSSVFNRFINLMAAVPDVTFGEFLGFISTNNDPKLFAAMEKKIVKQVIKGKSSQVTSFYTSDRFRKS